MHLVWWILADVFAGFTLSEQLAIRAEVISRFPSLRWLDVVSKADLGDKRHPVYELEPSPRVSNKSMAIPKSALKVSSTTGHGIDALMAFLAKETR